MFASRPVLLAILLSVTFAPAASAQQPANEQTIELFSYGFRPGPIALAAGKEVTLKFVDTAGSGHDFTAPEFFAASRIVAGDVKEGRGRAARRRYEDGYPHPGGRRVQGTLQPPVSFDLRDAHDHRRALRSR